MKSYREIMSCAQDKKISQKAWDITDKLTQDFIEDMRASHPERVHDYLKNLEDTICYPPLTETEAQQYVSQMANKDGSTGGHWSLAQVKEMAMSHPELKRFDCLDFYVTVNVMWSDYYHPNRKEEDYVSLACDFLDDKDAPKNKMRRYMEAIK